MYYCIYSQISKYHPYILCNFLLNFQSILGIYHCNFYIRPIGDLQNTQEGIFIYKRILLSPNKCLIGMKCSSNLYFRYNFHILRYIFHIRRSFYHHNILSSILLYTHSHPKKYLQLHTSFITRYGYNPPKEYTV